MIYDHIKNIGLYKGLTPALDTALDYISAAKMPLENGTTMLENGVKVIVSEYMTKLEEPKGYEAHLKFLDIQYVLDGEEGVKISPLEYLKPCTEYNVEKDRTNYYETDAPVLTIGNGYFVVVWPDDAHMPCMAVGESKLVKKITVKVPVK